MTWFERIRPPKVKIPSRASKIPEGLWVKCDGCKEIIYKKEVDKNLNVCPRCNYHFRIGARERIEQILDEGSFAELDSGLTAKDPLKFKDSKRYKERIKESIKKTGLLEAVVSGQGKLYGKPVQIAAFDFNFMGGSMASVAGEKVCRAIERASEKGEPLIIVSCSGGARMQEGVYSLMQMAKTCSALASLDERKVPFISLLADPTTGGVTASFAMLGDVIIAEPGALIGFAGPRVIEHTIKQKLPDGFQRAEFLLEHGIIDMVVDRRNLKEMLGKLLNYLSTP